MSPRSNANRPVGSTPKPSRKSPSPSVVTLIHSISPNAIRLTLPSSAFPPGKSYCPYHSHGAESELYLVISGRGTVRDKDGISEVAAGDAFFFGPVEAHQLSNNGTEDFAYYVIADNPRHDSCYYPDSGKWAVSKESPDYIIVQGNETDYYKDEE